MVTYYILLWKINNIYFEFDKKTLSKKSFFNVVVPLNWQKLAARKINKNQYNHLIIKNIFV
jgi:hypothetical protein